MSYTLVPANDDGKELVVRLSPYNAPFVSKNKPFICETDADLLRAARVAPFLLIKELGMTCGEMLAKAHEEVQAVPTPEPDPPAADATQKPAADGHICPECGRTCKSAYTLGAHMKSHKGGE